MRKRLQVLLDEHEHRDIQRAAGAQKLSMAEWVRHVLRSARRQQPEGDARQKLEIVRAAARHSYPSGDIGAMLGEIGRGCLSQEPE